MRIAVSSFILGAIARDDTEIVVATHRTIFPVVAAEADKRNRSRAPSPLGLTGGSIMQ
jgi:hypothetical protein